MPSGEHTCVEADHIHSPEQAIGLRAERLHRIRIGHVTADPDHLHPARSREVRRSAAGRVRLDVGQNHTRRTVFDQGRGKAQADAAGPAGDHRAGALEVVHRVPPGLWQFSVVAVQLCEA